MELDWLAKGATVVAVGSDGPDKQELAPEILGAPAKVVVIESAELMNLSAANALLKTLEEPPPDTYLLLASARPGRLLPTIVSRCQSVLIGRDLPLAHAEEVPRRGDVGVIALHAVIEADGDAARRPVRRGVWSERADQIPK